jgi:hypothetical protein
MQIKGCLMQNLPMLKVPAATEYATKLDHTAENIAHL